MKTYFLNFAKVFSIAVILFVFGSFSTHAQDEDAPVKWKLAFDKKAEKLAVNDKFTANLKAEIEKGWYLYALEKVEGGPIPTRITIGENQPFAIDKITASEPSQKNDSAFGVITKFYKEKADFLLFINILKDISDTKNLQIKVRYQTCNDEICLPPKTVLVEAEL